MRRWSGPALLLRLAATLAAGCLTATPLLAQGRVDHVPGIVLAEEGNAIRAATIVAENAKAKPHLFATTADGEGRFFLSGLTAGAWTFTVTAQGYIPVQRTILLPTARRVPPMEVIMRKGQWQPPPPLAEGRLAGVSLFRLLTALQNADTLMRAKQYDQAIAIVPATSSQAPALTRANLAIAEAWRMKKDFDRASSAYREVLAAEPGNEMALLGFRAAKSNRGSLEQAETYPRPSRGPPQAGSGHALRAGRRELARRQLEAARIGMEGRGGGSRLGTPALEARAAGAA